MASLGTTSIDQLPVVSNQSVPDIQNKEKLNTSTNLGEQNIKIENYGQQLNSEKPINPTIQEIHYSSDFNSIIKDAAAVGATDLPSRDIPQNTISLQQDEQIKPNFIPEKGNDYIGDILNKEKILKENEKKQNQFDNIDYIYQQIQIPILVTLLYFIFQLPVVRKQILVFLPSLFNKDGNPNFYGYIFNSIIFGFTYFLLLKSIEYINV